jgi:hypothetical protein
MPKSPSEQRTEEFRRSAYRVGWEIWMPFCVICWLLLVAIAIVSRKPIFYALAHNEHRRWAKLMAAVSAPSLIRGSASLQESVMTSARGDGGPHRPRRSRSALATPSQRRRRPVI